ncbi:MAG: glycosyltransferase family 2 protein [bacterium]
MRCSIVIPVNNERDNLPILHEELQELIKAEDRVHEVIWVDDGSTDGSSRWLRDTVSDRHKALFLRSNFGQSAAMKAGLDCADGNVIVFMDGDAQNDPEDVPDLLNRLQEGNDVVSGWRKDRKGSYLRRVLPSQIANGVISYTTGVKLHDYGCSLKAYRAEILEDLPLYGQLHRFLPALASWKGIEVEEIPVSDRPRQHGTSHYGLGRTWEVLMDLLIVKFLIDYRFRPIRIFGRVSLYLFLMMTLGGIYLGYLKIYANQSLSDHALTTVTVLFGLVGMQSLILGMLGEQQARMYTKASGEEPYAIRQTVNVSD